MYLRYSFYKHLLILFALVVSCSSTYQCWDLVQSLDWGTNSDSFQHCCARSEPSTQDRGCQVDWNVALIEIRAWICNHIHILCGMKLFICTTWQLNSLWPSDTIWRQRSGSTLAQVMACCLTTPSHYLNQCWLIVSKVLWHSSEGIIMRRFEDINE